MDQQTKSKIISFATLKDVRLNREKLSEWTHFYSEKTHEDLLQDLVFQHENNFPLRSSSDPSDRLRHSALVNVLQERAHTQFLKSFLNEIGVKAHQ